MSGAEILFPLNLHSGLCARFNFRGRSVPSVLLTYETVQTSKQSACLIRHLIIYKGGKVCIWEIKTWFSKLVECQ